MATSAADSDFSSGSGSSTITGAVVPVTEFPDSNAYALQFYFPRDRTRECYTDEEAVVVADSDEKREKLLESLGKILRITTAKVDHEQHVITFTYKGSFKDVAGKREKWIKDVKDKLGEEVSVFLYKIIYTGPGADEVKRQVDNAFPPTSLSCTQSKDNLTLLLLSQTRQTLDDAIKFVEKKQLGLASAGEFVTSTGLHVSAFKADITKLNVEAIVSAVDEVLSFSGGVSQAIARAAGDELVQEASKHVKDNGRAKVTEVVVTTGGKLPCKNVLHAVGPRRKDYSDDALCQQDLTNTVFNCLVKASDLGLTTIGIPAISSGTFQVPYDICASSYQKAVERFDQRGGSTSLQHIVFVFVDNAMRPILLKTLRELQIACLQRKSKTELRVALIGQMGVGKSAAGNNILGKPNAFKSKNSFNAVTEISSWATTIVPEHQLALKVVDTPGLFEPGETQKERIKHIEKEMLKSLFFLHPGPHVILVIVRAGRFSPTEASIYKQAQKLFPNWHKHTIVVFTYVNTDTDLEDLLEEAGPGVKELVKQCGERVAAINNVASEADLNRQVDKLITKIVDLYKENGKRFYWDGTIARVLQRMVFTESTSKTVGEMQQEALLDKVHKTPEVKQAFKTAPSGCTVL